MKPILDPPKPDYADAAFPRKDFPKYAWDARPATLPPEAWTTETTHRDGQQGGVPLTPEQGLRIYDILCRFTRGSGAIRQAEFFVYSAADREMLRGALERYRGGAPIEPTTWIRASVKDVELIRSLGVRETGMLASASDYHTFHKFKPAGRASAARAYLDAVKMTLDAGIRPRLHLEDATRAPLEFIAALVEHAQALAAPYGPELRPKFRVCDTMGVGLPYDDVAVGVVGAEGEPALGEVAEEDLAVDEVLRAAEADERDPGGVHGEGDYMRDGGREPVPRSQTPDSSFLKSPVPRFPAWQREIVFEVSGSKLESSGTGIWDLESGVQPPRGTVALSVPVLPIQCWSGDRARTGPRPTPGCGPGSGRFSRGRRPASGG